MNQKKIIMLDFSKELDNSKIVEDFIFEIHPKNFILDLNHEYKDVRVIWHYNKNWTLMKSNLQKECIKKGVKDEHIPFIEDTIDKNYNNITATQEKYDDDQPEEEEEEKEEEKNVITSNLG